MSPTIPRCQHIKTNGVRCGSPALRERRHCFFHHRAHSLRRLRLKRPNQRLVIPLLEDANSIQMAIQQVAEAIAEDRIDNRRAGLLLFAFQTAASNLKRLDLEPRELRESAGPVSPFLKMVMDELGIKPSYPADTDDDEMPPKKSPARAEMPADEERPGSAIVRKQDVEAG